MKGCDDDSESFTVKNRCLSSSVLHGQLRSVRQSLTDEALHTLVHAFITSHIDYCNALLYSVAVRVNICHLKFTALKTPVILCSLS